MNDKEKKIIELLKEELPRMSDFKKGYLLGMVEEMAGNKKKARWECVRNYTSSFSNISVMDNGCNMYIDNAQDIKKNRTKFYWISCVCNFYLCDTYYFFNKSDIEEDNSSKNFVAALLSNSDIELFNCIILEYISLGTYVNAKK